MVRARREEGPDRVITRLPALGSYLYPGTGVLTNRFGIREAERLARLERVLTRLKGQDRLHDLPMTARGFYAVHKHLMGDVYAWAGQARTIDMHLAGHRGQVLAEFEPAGRIKPGLHRLFAELKRDHYLAGSSVDRFAARAAHYVAELNRRRAGSLLSEQSARSPAAPN